MPNRHGNDNQYRYGYQGSEKDDEIKGNGNSYTTEFRMLDPRLGRWLSIDPLASSFPGQSPYCTFDNNPIMFNDPSGLAAEGGPGDGDKKTFSGPSLQEVAQSAQKNSNSGALEWGTADGQTFNGPYSAQGASKIAEDMGSFLTSGPSYVDLPEVNIVSSRNNAFDNKMKTSIGLEKTLNSYADESWNAGHYFDAFVWKIKAFESATKGEVGLKRNGWKIMAGSAAVVTAPLAANTSVGIALRSGGKYALAGKVGLNYTSETMSSGSFNPLNHNALSYALCYYIAKSPSISSSIPKQMAIGASSGLIEFKFNGFKLKGAWNQSVGTTMLKVINGGTAPIMGDYYGTLRQGIGGYAIDEYESKIKK